MSQALKVAKNTIFLLSASLLTRFLSMALTMYITRTLGVEAYGKYALVYVYIQMFGFFVDLGMGTLLVREVGKDNKSADFYLPNALAISFISATFFYLVMLIIFQVLAYKPDVVILGIVGGVSLLTNAFIAMFNALFNGLQRMEVTAAMQVVFKLLVVTSGVTALLLGFYLIGLLGSYLMSSAITALCLAFIVKRFGIRIWGRIAPGKMLKVLKETLPFTALMIVGMIYARIDVVLLSKISSPHYSSEAAVGYYSASMRILEFFTFIPTSLEIALLPLMSYLYAQARDRMWLTYRESVRLLAIISIPIVVIMTFRSYDIVTMVFGKDFHDSGRVLPFLAWGLFTIFMDIPALNILKNSRLLNVVILYVLVNAGINIGLNFVMIPKYSFVGAGVVCGATKFLDMIVLACLLRIIAKGSIGLIVNIYKPLLCALPAGAVLYLLPKMNFFLVSVLATIVYLLFLFALRAFKSYDLALLVAIKDKIKDTINKK